MACSETAQRASRFACRRAPDASVVAFFFLLARVIFLAGLRPAPGGPWERVVEAGRRELALVAAASRSAFSSASDSLAALLRARLTRARASSNTSVLTPLR